MKRLFRLAVRLIAILGLIAIIAAAAQYWRTRQIRETLWAAFTPVHVTNCELQRFGPNSDGGYPLCVNLLQDAKSDVHLWHRRLRRLGMRRRRDPADAAAWVRLLRHHGAGLFGQGLADIPRGMHRT